MSNSTFDLTGKTVLITGGNGGIGLGMAEELAKSGADICIWGQNEEKNKSATEKLKSYGRQVIAFKCDVSDENQVEHNFARTIETMGKVNACFANAGVGRVGTAFHKMSLKEWRSLFSVNMEGVFFTFRSVVRHMLEQGNGGSLVVTSSLSAKYGMPAGEHYAATKAGVIAIVNFQGNTKSVLRNHGRIDAIGTDFDQNMWCQSFHQRGTQTLLASHHVRVTGNGSMNALYCLTPDTFEA